MLTHTHTHTHTHTNRNSVNQPQSQFTVGAVSRINVQVDIANIRDDAFQAVLSFTFATNQLQVERVYNISSDVSPIRLVD